MAFGPRREGRRERCGCRGADGRRLNARARCSSAAGTGATCTGSTSGPGWTPRRLLGPGQELRGGSVRNRTPSRPAASTSRGPARAAPAPSPPTCRSGGTPVRPPSEHSAQLREPPQAVPGAAPGTPQARGPGRRAPRATASAASRPGSRERRLPPARPAPGPCSRCCSSTASTWPTAGGGLAQRRSAVRAVVRRLRDQRDPLAVHVSDGCSAVTSSRRRTSAHRSSGSPRIGHGECRR